MKTQNEIMIDEKNLMRVNEYARKNNLTTQAIYKQMKLKQVVFKKILGMNYILIKETKQLNK